MACFVPDRAALRAKPLQQIWRDHLLSGALVSADIGYDEGAFVFLAPEANTACSSAIAKYRAHLTRDDTFLTWSLEEVLRPLTREGGPRWASDVSDRYLGWHRLDEALARSS